MPGACLRRWKGVQNKHENRQRGASSLKPRQVGLSGFLSAPLSRRQMLPLRRMAPVGRRPGGPKEPRPRAAKCTGEDIPPKPIRRYPRPPRCRELAAACAFAPAFPASSQHKSVHTVTVQTCWSHLRPKAAIHTTADRHHGCQWVCKRRLAAVGKSKCAAVHTPCSKPAQGFSGLHRHNARICGWQEAVVIK